MGRAVCVGVGEVVCLYSEVLSLSDHVISASAIPCSTCAVYPRSCQYFSHFVRKNSPIHPVFQDPIKAGFNGGWPSTLAVGG